MKPLVLCILDGVGIADAGDGNAVTRARMPFYDTLLANCPNTTLAASGPAVGLPPRTMGNSEVGHITIGAGRIVNQFLRRFQLAKPTLKKNAALKKFLGDAGRVHVLGLCSDGRVHASIDDSIFVAKLAADAGHEIVWHFVADGRDVAPKSAAKYIKQIRSEFAREITADKFRFGTLCGRYYAFDRNENWDRTELAFDAIARGRAEFSAPDIETALSDAYARGETDEFIKPTVIGNQESGIRNRDGLLFTNYRADRARQILKIFTGIHTSSFILHPSSLLCFSQYGEGLDEFCPALLPDIPVKNTLGDVLAAAGLSQLRIAETEKYNHVTYFFDAERNVDFPGEEKILIASPDVATFDLKPEMSAREITAALLPELKNFDVVILNFANGDMVGHSGNIRATVRAMETLDKCLARIVPAVLKLGGVMLITADHGNAEKMTARGTPWTAHTTNKVPFIIVRNQEPGTRNQKLRAGGLSNIAPTILKILGIKKPREMTGRSLI